MVVHQVDNIHISIILITNIESPIKENNQRETGGGETSRWMFKLRTCEYLIFKGVKF